MLGSMVFEYCKRVSDFDVYGSVRDLNAVPEGDRAKMFLFDAEKDLIKEKIFNKFSPDYIINCIGVIKPRCTDDDPPGIRRAININAYYPHVLVKDSEETGAKIIQIATDCVYSGGVGHYKEKDPHDALDVYGKTKSLGEALHPNILHIRTSVIGPERKGKLNLLEWFLSQKENAALKGFAHHYWNGATTLQFAKVCRTLIEKEMFSEVRKISPVHHYIVNTSVNKYELLHIFNTVFEKKCIIDKVDNIGPGVDRTLSSEWHVLSPTEKKPMEEAIAELKKYMDEIHYYAM